jgi:two-component system, sensor histidine kinase RegB
VPTEPEPDVTLPWLIRLRWLFLAGQTVATAAAWYLDLHMRWGVLLAAIGAGLASNVAFAIGLGRRAWSRPAITGGVLVLDTALLTVLFASSGGASNPFTILYVVHITLSAVVLSARWTAMVAVLSVGGFALLFLPAVFDGGHHVHHEVGFGPHLQGMWLAFVLATGLTASFVGRISRAITSQRDQIAALRETSARNARLAALTTLAAGAAHELGSPLATIAIAGHEAHLRAAALAGAAPIAEDLRLILLEVDRCQEILHRMAARGTQGDEADAPLSGAELARRIRDALGPERAARVDLQLPAEPLPMSAPIEQMAQSVAALVKNGLDASSADGRVAVALERGGGDVRIAVEDRGAGIPSEQLARVGEPFFTTKQPGRGLGLGVFLVRAFAESRGGVLDVESTVGVGTRAVLRLPVSRPS